MKKMQNAAKNKDPFSDLDERITKIQSGEDLKEEEKAKKNASQNKGEEIDPLCLRIPMLPPQAREADIREAFLQQGLKPNRIHHPKEFKNVEGEERRVEMLD